LPGGQFAKFYLGLQPALAGANVTVVAEWDRPDPGASGVGFYILDASGLARAGEEPLSNLAIAAGGSGFGGGNVQGAAVTASGLQAYTIVLFNNSASDANVTLHVSNGVILDESYQVQALPD
jgi:hypothetical protein